MQVRDKLQASFLKKEKQKVDCNEAIDQFSLSNGSNELMLYLLRLRRDNERVSREQAGRLCPVCSFS